ncbi:hypothetical protein C2S53_008781 [Perilla frutescens var. hirtella]|uniref:Receptor-like serine/threonine-protein kinase n=1 Tax=Perilla frutescens var. hirtella TaxID=608512 RepID=A0AAD4NYL6_PERFH|nr:hypothetical protein C2S53_008781 [Perilla frutescens var. hirtella]
MQTHKAASSIFRSVLFWIYVQCLGIKVSYCIDTLKQGDSLNSSSQLDSPNGLFTLKFYDPQETNNSYIAVLFNRGETAPVQIPAVWVGNREDPIPNNSTPLLTLGTRGELIITRRHGGDPIQLYGAGSPRSNVTATLLDTGNFVVKNISSNEVLWQSYDHPTDTLLSGMKLGSGANRSLSSWLTETNPAPGAFTLEWDMSGSAGELLIRRRGVPYWRSGHLKDYYDRDLGNVKQLENLNIQPDVFNFNYNLSNEGGYFMFTVMNESEWTPESRRVVSGWRLSPQGDVSTIDDRGQILNIFNSCYGYSTQGLGCQVWEQPKCRNRHQTFDLRSGMFRHANQTPVSRTYDFNSSLSLSDCREACWRWPNCECVGYNNFVGENSGCWYWIGKDLVWEQDLDGSTEKIYVLQSSGTGKKKKFIGIILGVVSAAALLILGLACLIIRNRRVKMEEELHELLTLDGCRGTFELENRGANNHHLKLFTHASILSATRNFSSNNKLGEGGFGPVYKGRTAEGQDIAVKLLSRQSGQGLLEFKNELILISELQHVNLVKLIGFCVHKDDKMIIYDYMPNKSLDFFLFSESKRAQLDWQKRFSIIEGTAQGLVYLHKHSRLKIIHRDLKPNNILLDENMTPKISDFGLARIFKEDSGEANTNRRVGTYGYMAPEYAMQGIFSVKSDVYSFGVLVLEIVSGRRNSSFHNIEGPLSIVEYAWEMWRKDCALELMDPMLRGSCIIDQLQKCIQIGLLCVENNAADRPTIEDVLSMLKNDTATLPMPTNPAFITRNNLLQQVDKLSSNELRKFSANEITLSQIHGR